jgi:hypothetical protein
VGVNFTTSLAAACSRGVVQGLQKAFGSHDIILVLRITAKFFHAFDGSLRQRCLDLLPGIGLKMLHNRLAGGVLLHLVKSRNGILCRQSVQNPREDLESLVATVEDVGI